MITQTAVRAHAEITGPSLAEFTRLITQELATEEIALPSFPEVALRVRNALADRNMSIDNVVRIVSAEPALAVRLLELANSVAIARNSQRVSTLRAAITRIGFDLARSATIAFAMAQMRRGQAWRALQGRFRELWSASAQLAAMSYVVARRMTRIEADQALLAGMLHAVGKLYVLTRASAFPELLADNAAFAEIESAWHARAARSLLKSWGMGADVIEAACGFEDDERAEPTVSLGDVLFVARCLSTVREPGELAAGSPLLLAPPFERLGLDAAACEEILSASAAEVASLRAALSE